ncbi:MAG: DUF115 domain-containing protein [Simkaniaceae bacterium]|nr:DUF115 domain-containing protein [Simkaniaceae bacterium]MCF7851637.1 DUF115 domain-containing protein [Simkaniaceae bacterium]
MSNIELLREKNPGLALQITLTHSKATAFISDQIPIKGFQHLCIYGAHPQAIVSLLPWLSCDLNHQLYLIDHAWDDFLNEKSNALCLEHPRVHCYAANQEEDLKRLSWNIAFRSMQFVSLRPDGDAIKKKLYFFKEGVELSLVDGQDKGMTVLSNVMDNLSLFKDALYLLKPMKGCLKGKPALICGAGPSLKDQYEAIAQLSSRAYLFAGVRALEMLKSVSIRADFGGVIDPLFVSHQIEDVTRDVSMVFYQDRAASDMMRRVQQPCVWSGVGEGYPLQTWLYRHLGISHFFEAGWNVSNFLTNIAVYLGCYPIIFAGQDHCYRKEEKYAESVPHLDNMKCIEVRDRQGDIVKTKRDFLMSIQWIERLIQEKSDIDFYQLGTLGLEVQGLKIWSRDLPVMKKEKCPLTQQPVDFDPLILKVSFDRALVKCDLILETLKSMIKVGKPQFSPLFTLHDIELKEEICYAHYLRPMWDQWKYLLDQASDKNEVQPFDLDQIKSKVCEIGFYKDLISRVIRSF